MFFYFCKSLIFVQIFLELFDYKDEVKKRQIFFVPIKIICIKNGIRKLF
jgi:hypothetical protein